MGERSGRDVEAAGGVGGATVVAVRGAIGALGVLGGADASGVVVAGGLATRGIGAVVVLAGEGTLTTGVRGGSADGCAVALGRGGATGATAVVAETANGLTVADGGDEVSGDGTPVRENAHVAPPSNKRTNSKAPTNADVLLGAGTARGTVVPSFRPGGEASRIVSEIGLAVEIAVAIGFVSRFVTDCGSCAFGGRCGPAS